MKVPFPYRASRSWNEVVLGKYSLPGLGKLDIRVSNEVEKKKPKGTSGASTTFQGRNVASLKLSLAMWDEEQFAAFQEMLPDLWPSISKEAAAPLEIVHPKARLWGIRSVVIETIDDTQPDNSGDYYVIKFDLSQWQPPVKTGSGSATKTATSLDPRRQSLGPDLGGTTTIVQVPSKSGASRP